MKRHAAKILGSIKRLVSPVKLAAAAAAVGLFLFLILGDNGIYQFRQLMEMRNRLLMERERLNEQLDGLTVERTMLSDPSNLEPVIRRELGYIKPGEVLFVEKDSKEREASDSRSEP